MEPETIESLSTLPLVRCKTCGKVLGNIYKRFIELRDLEALADQTTVDENGVEIPSSELNFVTPGERAFNKLGVTNECCRSNLNNPPKIPVGGYFFRPERMANTYTMGEYGKNYGDPAILDYLNKRMTDPEKKSLINSKVKPVYKRVISTSNQRYGKQFQPSLQERFKTVITSYINLNPHEMEAFRKSLWYLFLYSMYVRGWKGQEYSYPLGTTGLPDLMFLIDQRKNLQLGLEINYYSFLKNLRSYLTYIHKEELIPAVEDELTEYRTNLRTDTPIIDSLDIEAALIHLPEEQVAPNKEGMEEYFSKFRDLIKYSNGVLSLYREINSINYMNNEPIKQQLSLHSRVASIHGNNQPINDDPYPQVLHNYADKYDYARIIAITCYYILELVSGIKIPNFNVSEINIYSAGIPSPQIISVFKPAIE